MILSLHIPKTGGNTFCRVLTDHYGKKAVFRTGTYPLPKVPKGTKVIHGHFVYGIHEAVSEPCEYIAFLREPVDRVISYYAMSLRAKYKDWPGRYQEFWAGGQPMPLLEFATGGINMPGSLDNAMVRQLAGPDWYYNPQLVTREAYEMALAHLRQCHIGLTERMSESVTRFAKRYGWKTKPLIHANESHNRPTITIGERRKIERYNRWSVKLYKEAVRLFDDQS